MPGYRKRPAHPPPVERFNQPVIIFLTVCSKGRRPLLARSDIVSLLLTSWAQATSWQVGRYIVMPDHIHLFCAPGEWPHRPLAQWVRYWKTVASRAWPRPEEQPVWQLDSWDTQLRDSSHYEEKWEYVSRNPVRAGLVENAEDWAHQGVVRELRW